MLLAASESIRQQALHFNKFQNELPRTCETFTAVVIEQNRRFRQFVQDLPKIRLEEREASETLAKLGWYLDPKMPWDAQIRIAKIVSETNDVDVVEPMSDYFRQRTNAIEEELKSSYPNRNDILCDAFQAHREKKFNLSIPVFLAQADGMWWDKFDGSVFRENRVKVVEAHITSLRDDEYADKYADMFEIFSSPTIPLWESESTRDSSFSEFNRHQILHGEIVNYGTEVNSLKAISFLSWLRWILSIRTDVR